MRYQHQGHYATACRAQASTSTTPIRRAKRGHLIADGSHRVAVMTQMRASARYGDAVTVRAVPVLAPGFDACRAAHLMSGRQEAVTGVRDTVTAPLAAQGPG